jgi:hypothetical protein
MSITTRIKDAYAALRGQTGLTGRGSAVASSQDQFSRMLQVSYERSQIHRDIQRMDKTCPIISTSHSIYADRSTGMEDPNLDVFQVAVEPATQSDHPANQGTVDRSQSEIDALIRRTDLRPELWQVARRTPEFGNEFRENLIDGDEIVELKLLPEHTMWPLMDARGNRIPGYVQRLENGISDPIAFSELEIIHFKFGELDGFLGTPLFGCARKDWKRLNMSEDVTAIARLESLGARWIYDVPVGTNDPPEKQQAAINAFKANMTQMDYWNQSNNSIEKWETPKGIVRDVFLPNDGSNRGGVTMLDPNNTQLTNLADLEYFLNRLITASRIPKRYFPFEGSTPKLSEGGGTSEDKHFACALMSLQMSLKQGMTQLFDRQLLLKGIDPSSVRYVIRMADINTTDQLRRAQTQVAAIKAMQILLAEYPELREELPVMLREFAQMSDASFSTLSKVKVEPKPEPVVPVADPNPAPDNRTPIPGMGNPDAKANI